LLHEHLKQLVLEWNSDANNPQITLSHLQRIREATPQHKNSEQFFASVEAGDKDRISSPGAAEKWRVEIPGRGGLKHLDASKISWIPSVSGPHTISESDSANKEIAN